ncbi:sialate O-acetylesterase [Sphingobacterium pedocola]|uniref:Sialate O-acetylesterase n=1 Tax=Sphingobacterium pedocola TaxID=2082722 RepID=A0ABR9T835_9SPHI|nr:sialate O-acetylesterase [Sphingobacterium pedocola]MBE8721490.1 sialate O-acetylesterase [Sphingobacterium pedocola]
MQKFLAFLFFCTLADEICAQTAAIPHEREKVEIAVAKENFHLYLLIGQSNMAGRGIVEPQDTVGSPRILRLNSEGDWEIAKEPIHFDKPAAGVGPGLAFAREMLAGNKKEIVIGLIPCAAGGSSIDIWKQGVYWHQTNSYPYDDALKRTQKALQKGVLKGILWHQGEADQSPKKASVYKEKLVALVATLRYDFQTPEVPFIAGEVPHFRDNEAMINQAFHEAKQIIMHYDVVSGEGLTSLEDGVHLDAISQRKFGKRYAQKSKYLKKRTE